MEHLEIWRSGFVRRWHFDPDMAVHSDENAAHQGRCVLLLISLFPTLATDWKLMHYVATHDVPEVTTGDLSSATKAKYESLSEIVSEIAYDEARRLGVFYEVDAFGFKVAKFIDWLDAFLFARHKRPDLVLYEEKWQEKRREILEVWKQLRSYSPIDELGI